MAHVHFNLSNKPNSEGESLILISYSFGMNNRFHCSTCEVIKPVQWNKEQERAKKTFKGYSHLNSLLDAIADKVKEVERLTLANKLPLTKEVLKREIKSFLSPSEPEQKQTGLIKLLDQYINIHSNLRAKNTLKKFRTLKLHLVEFNRSTKTPLSIDNLNLAFYQSLINFLVSEGLNNTSAGKYIAAMKAFVRWLMDNEFSKPVDLRKWKVTDSENEVLALSKKELDKLFSLDLRTNKRLDQIRDLFVFSCVTGARFSDVQNLSPANITDSHITFTTVKTKHLLRVPLNGYSKVILKKYKNQLPKISNQKANLYLKELCLLAGFKNEVQKVAYYGNERKDTNLKKFEAITFHSGRKTFITLYLSSNGSREEIKKLTGLRDWQTMERYIAVDPVTAAENMNRIFTPPLRVVNG